ncbi:glycosyltransferase [Mesorhizobium sp. NBSH29]|uniref:glycosyltransferase n=1 Tax=Mesorhizobium sp. NBSH29 TaxID=2654249 RepID=UPI0018968DA7|nr:glycosyltransferase [Mesorhizobium sp. NBSH29]
MRILITNNTLGLRAGSELYVFDIALELKKRGHKVVAYSSTLGLVSDMLRNIGVPTIDELSQLTDTPDVIHAHHHMDAAAAGLHFPTVPVVQACHGWAPWQERPLALANVRQFVATSELTREYFVTSGVPSNRISIICNFVDPTRFKYFEPRPTPLRRALIIGNSWQRGSVVYQRIEEACRSQNISLDAFGLGMGSSVSSTEELYSQYGLVFGLGRCAIEGMAMGCAVVLADPNGLAGWVDDEQFDRYKLGNFGFGLLNQRDVTVDMLLSEIARINRPDVERVTQRVRSELDVRTAVNRWISLYESAIEEGPATTSAVIASASRYVIDLKKHFGKFEHLAHETENKISTISQAKDDLILQKKLLEHEKIILIDKFDRLFRNSSIRAKIRRIKRRYIYNLLLMVRSIKLPVASGYRKGLEAMIERQQLKMLND